VASDAIHRRIDPHIDRIGKESSLKIFVTGGSGFLGRRLIARLRQEGHEVSALSRAPQSDRLLESMNATPIRGSLTDIPRWQDALQGQEVVVHAASPIEVWGDWKTFERDIVRASLDLYRAAATQKVRRFIQISSESVLQGQGPLLDVTEAQPYPAEPNSYYGKAKMEVEKGLIAHGSGTECIILRPPYIWGHGGTQLDKVLEKVRRGQFMWIDHGNVTMEMVHVDNVAEAVCLSLTQGRSGQVYWVTDGHPMPTREFLGALIAARGVKVPDKSMPGSLARPVAAVVEALWRLFGIKSVPPLSRFQLDFIALPRRYDLTKSERDLGYKPVRAFNEGLAEMQQAGRT
jgi:2-alkyl-3-oxoalkanoate reductase